MSRAPKLSGETEHGRPIATATTIAWSDYATSLHMVRRAQTQERRLLTPEWAVRDEWLRHLLVTHLEERFFIKTDHNASLIERLENVKEVASRTIPAKRELLRAWIHDYRTLLETGHRDLSDDEALNAFTSLREIRGQRTFAPDLARDYLTRKRLRDLEIQIQNVDTDLVLTERGHAAMLASIVYLYYRLGWDSVTVAEELKLKSPHVRQVLARLHATWADSLASKFVTRGKGNGAGKGGSIYEQCEPDNEPAVEGAQPALPLTPLEKFLLHHDE